MGILTSIILHDYFKDKEGIILVSILVLFCLSNGLVCVPPHKVNTLPVLLLKVEFLMLAHIQKS